MKKYLYLIFSLLAVLVLSGCEMEIIEDKNAKYTLDPVDKGALVSDKYYVKDGTKFYQIYEPDMSNKSVGLSEHGSSKTRVLFQIIIVMNILLNHPVR